MAIYLLLFVCGIIAYIVSTLSGGGGALLLLPIVSFILGANTVAPVINLGNMIGRPARLILFWKDIKWELVIFYVPSAILGAVVGANIFIQLDASAIQLLLGVFLIFLALQYKWGKVKKTFQVKKWHFVPLGFIVLLISTLFGATGAILNPFYLNYGLVKEELIATKTANSFFAGIFQISSYVYLGALSKDLWIYGIFIGLGAIVGNIIGKRVLKGISDKLFIQLVLLVTLISGIIMIYKSFKA